MRAYVLVLCLCMLLTGTINTIATKFQDITVVGHTPDGRPITFNHPAVQSACMFFGEALCLIPYFYMRWRRQRAKRRDPAYVPMHPDDKRSRRIARIMAFAVPTLCDATATTAMNLGLFYTYASTYQMLRGTLVLFAGAFTVLILRRQLYVHNWLGMVLITAGAALVGASSVIYQGTVGPGGHSNAALAAAAAAAGDFGGGSSSQLGPDSGGGWYRGMARIASRGMLSDDAAAAAAGGAAGGGAWWRLGEGGGEVAAAPLFGDLLVIAAQMFTAMQFILEEKFLVKYKVPSLLAVGLEGCWGLVLSCLVLPLASVVTGPGGAPLDDAPAALAAIFSIRQLGLSVGISILSIAAFNFFGVSVTKSLSGAARATIDACRTIFIWLFALRMGWESFHALEVVGFMVLISGTSLYNEILKTCMPGTALVTEHQPPQQPRSRPRLGAARPVARSPAPADAALTAPLLASADEPDGEGPSGPAGGASSRDAAAGGWRAPPVPLRRPAPAHSQQVFDAGGASSQSGGSWVYTMARSMRLGMHTLSPQSLAATGGLAPDEELGSESEGCYSSYASLGGLASSFNDCSITPERPGGLAGSLGGSGAADMTVPPSGGSSSGFGVLAWGGRSPAVDGGGGSAAGGRAGGLSASLRGQQGAGPAGQAAAAAAGGSSSGGGSSMRRSGSSGGVPPLPRPGSASNLGPGGSSRSSRTTQQQQQ